MDLSPFERYRPLVDDWDAFAAALARPLPATIWTNTLRTTPERLSAWLARDGTLAEPIAWCPGAFRLSGARPGKSLAYISGHLHIQEEVALIPVILLDPRPGERLLDLCAAPGNKTVQAAVRMEDRGTVIANERGLHRIGVLRRNLERLGITCAAVTVGDAANLPRDAGTYDRVLADVPCSCEGTTRKNPEVLRRLGRIKRRAGGQLAILRKAVQLARPGGRIVYSTCTYAPEENEGVVGALLREAAPGSLRLLPARVEGLKTVPGLTAWRDERHPGGGQMERWDDQLELAMRVWPHHNDTGGFFVAVIEKLADGRKSRAREEPQHRSVAELPSLRGRSATTEGLGQDRRPKADGLGALAVLEQRFAISRTVFDDYVVFRSSRSILSLVRRDLRVPNAPDPVALGMPFFYADMRHPRPTSAAVLKFGNHATRNVLDLDDEQLIDFVFGREIALDDAAAAGVDGPGWVIGRHRGSPIGIGRCWDQDGTLVLRGMVPKVWAAQLAPKSKPPSPLCGRGLG